MTPKKRTSFFEYRTPVGDGEIRAYADLLDQAFPQVFQLQDLETWLGREEPEGFRAAIQNGRLAGTTMIVKCGQWFGGRQVPMGGIRGVATAPHARGKGAARFLMERSLHELHDAEIPIASLYPATHTLYRRAGYELAGDHIGYRIDLHRIPRIKDRLEIEPIDPADSSIMKSAYDARAKRTNGQLARTGFFWLRVNEQKLKMSRAFRIVGKNGKTEGYFAFVPKEEHGGPAGLQMRDLVFNSRDAARTALGFFSDQRSMNEFVWFSGAPTEPIEIVLGEHGLKTDWRTHWMLRIVDVAGALEARGYSTGVEGEIHFDITDDLLPWNNGRFVLHVEKGRATVRAGGRGRLTIDVRGLASLYSGFLAADDLEVAGLLTGSAREMAAATALFCGPRPWMVDWF